MHTLDDVHRLFEAGLREQRLQLAALTAEVAALRERLHAAAPARSSAKAGDIALTQQLLPLLYRRWPAAVFETREVLALAEVDSHVATALRPLVVDGGDAGKRLGRLLKRCAGQQFSGYRLRLVREIAPLLFAVSNPQETE